jgi:hypothetical protein
MKKYMIVPYQEPKMSLHEEKINSILKNLYINNLKKKRRYIIIIYANLSYPKLQLTISVFLLCII